MHKKIFLILPLLLVLMLSGCQKASINGDLDGRWQLLEIEKRGVTESIKDQQLYMNFYLHVCSLSYYGGTFTEGNLKYENNKIWMQFPYINTLAGLNKLETYGIYSNPVEFQVEYISKDKMIIKEGDIIITLRKF